MTHIDSSAVRNDGASVSEASSPAASSSVADASTAPENGGHEGTPPAMEPARVREIGGRKDGPEPTRFGDWERNGRCVDF